jgi:hypothetical protein
MGFAQGQEKNVALIKKVTLQARAIESDNMGNVYMLNGGVISKYTFSGELMEKNSSLAFGEVSSLDASNALKMVAYFKDLSQIVYLDNQLGARGESVALDELGYFQITEICRSYNDGLWIYDQTTFELTRLNERLEVDVESGNLAQVLGVSPDPNYIREVNNWVYVNDPDNGVFVFDWYGSYTKTIPVKGVQKFVVRADRLFFMKDNRIQYYHLITKQFSDLKLPEINFIDFTIFENKLLLITENELLIYRINVN